jgi:hypothetical protein
MIARHDLAVIARSRLREAKALFKSRHYDGAAYLCGYAVEMALKARLCQHLRRSGFPENRGESKWAQALKIHDLAALLELTGMEARIRSSHVAEWAAISTNWTPELRYRVIGSLSSTSALAMVEAAAALLRALL